MAIERGAKRGAKAPSIDMLVPASLSVTCSGARNGHAGRARVNAAGPAYRPSALLCGVLVLGRQAVP